MSTNRQNDAKFKFDDNQFRISYHKIQTYDKDGFILTINCYN